MSLEIPPGLQWLSYLAGSSWPKGDEDKLFALSKVWGASATDLENILPALHGACDTALANYTGGGADQMKSQFDQFFSGDNSIENMVKGLQQIEGSVYDCGTQTEYAKLQIIITLAIMAAEIAYALATLWGAWAVGVIEAEGAGIMRIIASRLASALANQAAKIAEKPLWKLAAIEALKQGGIGMGADALAQGIQLSKGHRHGFDTKQMLVSGAVGAVSAGVATPVGHYLGSYLGKWVAGEKGMTWWKAGLVAVGSGIPAGVVGAGAGFVTSGVLTGQWEFDPTSLLGGVGGGLVGGVHGVLGHMTGHYNAQNFGGHEEPPPAYSNDRPPAYGDGTSKTDLKNNASTFPASSKGQDTSTESQTNGNGRNGNSGNGNERSSSPVEGNGNSGNNGSGRNGSTANDNGRSGTPANNNERNTGQSNGNGSSNANRNSTPMRDPANRQTPEGSNQTGPRASSSPSSIGEHNQPNPIAQHTGQTVTPEHSPLTASHNDQTTAPGAHNQVGGNGEHQFGGNAEHNQTQPENQNQNQNQPETQAQSSTNSNRPPQTPRTPGSNVPDGSSNPFQSNTPEQSHTTPQGNLGSNNPYRDLVTAGSDQNPVTPEFKSNNPFQDLVSHQESNTPTPFSSSENPFGLGSNDRINQDQNDFNPLAPRGDTNPFRRDSTLGSEFGDQQSSPITPGSPRPPSRDSGYGSDNEQSSPLGPNSKDNNNPFRSSNAGIDSRTTKSENDPFSKLTAERQTPIDRPQAGNAKSEHTQLTGKSAQNDQSRTATPESNEHLTGGPRAGTPPKGMEKLFEHLPHNTHLSTEENTGKTLLNDCGRQSLQHLAEEFPHAGILPPSEPVGLHGMGAEDFQARAGGPLQSFKDPKEVGAYLLGLGDGAAATVVVAYKGPTDHNNIGAHAYVLHNHDDRIHVWDPTTGTEVPFEQHKIPDIASTSAVLYNPATGHSEHIEDRPNTGVAIIGDTRIGRIAPTRMPDLTEFHTMADDATHNATKPPGHTDTPQSRQRDDVPAAAGDQRFGGAAGKAWDDVTELGNDPRQMSKVEFGRGSPDAHDVVAFGDESGARYVWSKSDGLTRTDGRPLRDSETLDSVMADPKTTRVGVPGASDRPPVRQSGPDDVRPHDDSTGSGTGTRPHDDSAASTKSDTPAEVRAPAHDPEIYQRHLDAQERAEHEQQQTKETIENSRNHVEETKRALDEAEATHDDKRIAEAQAAHDQATAQHRQTVEESVDRLMDKAKEAGTATWKSFQDGHIGKDEAFDLVRKERVTAARAAADSLLEFYDLEAGKDKTGPLAKLSNEDLEHRILNGSDKESRTAQIELMRRGTMSDGLPGGKVLRHTQVTAEILMHHGPVEMDTGEGKELTAIARATRAVIEKGIAHVMTSSDPLVVHMQHEFESLVAGDHGLGIDVYHLDSDKPFPPRDPNRKLIVVGTAQDYGFRAVKEAQAVVDKLKENGMPADELTQLRASLENAPSLQEYKKLLDAAAEKRGMPDRFEPFPGGDLIIDEIDAQLIDEQTHYVLSPGSAGKADEGFAQNIHDVWRNLQDAKESGVLGPQDFGKDPDRRGVFNSQLTGPGRAKLEDHLGRTIDDKEAEEFAHAAQAEWGPEQNSDYHVSDDGKIKIIASQTNDQVMDDPEKQSSSRWNGFAKYLEAKHGLDITADSEHSLSITGKQIFSGGHFDHITGMSGTLLTRPKADPAGVNPGESVKSVENVMHDEFGTGPISKVDRFFKSQLERPDDLHFENRDQKFAAMAKDILDTAFVKDPKTGAWEQKGSPQLAIAMDNADVARIADALHTEAAARNLKVKFDKLDVAWVDSHGSKDKANDELQKVIADGGEMGRIILGNKMMGRGVDITPSKEAIKAGGLKVKISGGPAYSDRVNHQAETRAARSGDPKGDWATGGTPGEAKHYISPEDYRSNSPDARVKTFITRYQKAATEHREATEALANDHSKDNETALEQAKNDLAAAEKDMRDQATPMQKATIEQQILNSRSAGEDAFDAHAPPLEQETERPAAPPPRSIEGHEIPTRDGQETPTPEGHEASTRETQETPESRATSTPAQRDPWTAQAVTPTTTAPSHESTTSRPTPVTDGTGRAGVQEPPPQRPRPLPVFAPTGETPGSHPSAYQPQRDIPSIATVLGTQRAAPTPLPAQSFGTRPDATNQPATDDGSHRNTSGDSAPTVPTRSNDPATTPTLTRPTSSTDTPSTSDTRGNAPQVPVRPGQNEAEPSTAPTSSANPSDIGAARPQDDSTPTAPQDRPQQNRPQTESQDRPQTQRQNQQQPLSDRPTAASPTQRRQGSWLGRLFQGITRATPQQQTSGHQTPEQQTSGHQTPEQQTSGHQTPEQQTSGHQTPEQQTLPAENSPDYNTAQRAADLLANCAVASLNLLSAFTGRPRAHVPANQSGTAGMSPAVLQANAGAPLRKFLNHDDIAEQLKTIGPGAVALVVDDYRDYTNAKGVGAHAYLLRVGPDGTSVQVHDSSNPKNHAFPPAVPRELAGTHAVLYNAEGAPAHIVPAHSDELPAATLIGELPLSDPVKNFGAHRRGAEDLINIRPIPQRTIEWLRRQVVHAVETKGGKSEAAQWVQQIRAADPKVTDDQINTTLDELGVDQKFKDDVNRILTTGPVAAKVNDLVGKKPEGVPDSAFRAAVEKTLTSRLTTAEMYRLLSESGMPLGVEYQGRSYPVFLRLKLRARDKSRPYTGPAVSTQKWTYGSSETSDSAGSHDLRSTGLTGSHLRDAFSTKLLNWGFNWQLNLNHNQLASNTSIFSTIQSVIKKRSTEAAAVPHDFEMQWEYRLNDDGVAGLLKPDLPTATDWTPIEEPTPDDLTAFFPKYLHESPGLPTPTDDASTPAPWQRPLKQVQPAAATPSSSTDPNATAPAPQYVEDDQTISQQQFPFYGPLDFPHHDRLFADVMASFPNQTRGISKSSAVALREFFGDNFRGNIPMMHGGAVQSPTLYTASGKPLGFFEVEIPGFHGGDTLTGPTTTPNASRLEYNVVRALRTQASSTISNMLGGSLALTFGLGKGKSDKKTGYSPIGATLTPLKVGASHQNSHSLSYGTRAYTSRALRLVSHLLHTTPEMEVRVRFVRPDGPVIEPQKGTPLAAKTDGGTPGKRYPINMLVPSKKSLGVPATKDNRRYPRSDILHLQQFGLMTTPVKIDIPDDVFDRIETFVSDHGFLPPTAEQSNFLDQDSTRNQRLENSRRLAQMKARMGLLGTADEMIQNGARTVFEKSNGLDTERITVTIKAARDYGTEDGKYDPKADPNQNVTHEWVIPDVQTMNYTGIILSSGEQSQSTPFAWDVGASAALTNPFDVEGSEGVSSIGGSYDRTGGTATTTQSDHNLAEENYTFSPGPKADKPGLQLFGVPTRYYVEIAYSHGRGPDPIEAKGNFHLAVPTYLTSDKADTTPLVEPTMRNDLDSHDAPPAEFTERLGFASKTSIENGVGRLPLAAVIAGHPVGEILHKATMGLIGDIERDAAAEASDLLDKGQPLPIPGAFPQLADAELPFSQPSVEPDTQTRPSLRSRLGAFVPDLSSFTGSWFKSSAPKDESHELTETGKKSGTTAPTDPAHTAIQIDAPEVPTEADITDQGMPKVQDPTEDENLPKVPGAWPDGKKTAPADDGKKLTWSDVGNWAWDKVAGAGKWVWRNAFGDPALDPTSTVSSVVHTSYSPQHMTSVAPQIFRDSYKFETEIPGGVAGTDYSVDVRGYFDNITALEPTPIDTEHWLEATNNAARTVAVNRGNQGGVTVQGIYGDHSDPSFRPSGGWQGSDSTSKHVTSGDATDTMRVTSDYGGKVYRFSADAHYAVTVKVGLRNYLTGWLRGKPYGTRTRIVDAPQRLEFFLTDNDLHDNPEYLALVRQAAKARGEKLDIIPEGMEMKDGKWTPTERRLLSDAYTEKRPDDPDTAKGLLSFGAVTEVIFDDGRGALEDAATKLVEKFSPGATVVGSNNYHPGVAPLINEHTTSFGVRNLANVGSEGNHSFHFVDRTGLVPRLVGVTFTSRPRPNKDLPDGQTLETLEGKQVPRTAALDNVHRHIGADGNALLEPGATNVGTSRSKTNRLNVTLGGQENKHRPAGTLAVSRTGTHSDNQNSTRDLSAWQRSSDAQYEFKVPTEYTVTVDSRPMDETLSAYLADKLGDALIMGGQWMGVAQGLPISELPPPGKSESDSLNAISHVRAHISDTKPIPKAGEAAADQVPHTRPRIYAFDPSAPTLRPARISANAPSTGDIDLEANTHVDPADDVSPDVRKLLSVPPWQPEHSFGINEFDAAQQLAEALLAVDPSLNTNDHTRSPEAMYNRLVTLVRKGDLTFLGPQSTAPFLNVEKSGNAPTPQQHAAEVTVDGTHIKLSLYSPRSEHATKSFAVDEFVFSNDSVSSAESKSTTVAPSFGYNGPVSEDGNHRLGFSGFPLGGQTATKGGSSANASTRRDLHRTNAPTDGHRLRAVALLEVRGPKGTVWVTGDMVLRTIETPPESANVKDPTVPSEGQDKTDSEAAAKAAAEKAKKEAEDKAAAEKAKKEAAEKKAAEDKAKKEAEDKAAAEKAKKEAADKKAAEDKAKKEAEERKAAEEKAKREAEERKAAEEQATREAAQRKADEEKAKREAEQRKADEEKAKREAEEHKAAEEQATREAAQRKADEEKAKREAEERKAAEEQATREAAQRKADEEAAEKAQQEAAGEGAQQEANERKAAEEQAKREADERRAAEEQATREAEERKAAEAKAQQEADQRKAAEEQATREAEQRKA
ncbi:hypothetical protein ABIA39_006311, partial [Nocardia sp. GAS34]